MGIFIWVEYVGLLIVINLFFYPPPRGGGERLTSPKNSTKQFVHLLQERRMLLWFLITCLMFVFSFACRPTIRRRGVSLRKNLKVEEGSGWGQIAQYNQIVYDIDRTREATRMLVAWYDNYRNLTMKSIAPGQHPKFKPLSEAPVYITFIIITTTLH